MFQFPRRAQLISLPYQIKKRSWIIVLSGPSLPMPRLFFITVYHRKLKRISMKEKMKNFQSKRVFRY